MYEFSEKPAATPRLVQYFNKLGYDWEKMGRFREAAVYYKRAETLSTELFGRNHRLTQSLTTKIGGLKTQRKAV